MICPNLKDIKEIFKTTLNDIENIVYYKIEPLVDYDNNDENVIEINATIYTNDEDNFNMLQDYINNQNFTQTLEDNLDDNNLDIINVQSRIIDQGKVNNTDNDNDDDDDKGWYDEW
eukprot:CAMPEP_0201581766 /NCGR_PEP_ID=MMETSP0190_2-20130828/75258_1 /ASSEMBLY_ACC=CAM_ASM_000263 /TAXON_ID=37353 /ORGANISM="Rosalina sp." /LENGTH=115 /DNA_ID=CAMNT_0048020419 /DNA_START=269 /DNA_END=613 /DNA_ORIENTATION=-